MIRYDRLRAYALTLNQVSQLQNPKTSETIRKLRSSISKKVLKWPNVPKYLINTESDENAGKFFLFPFSSSSSLDRLRSLPYSHSELINFEILILYGQSVGLLGRVISPSQSRYGKLLGSMNFWRRRKAKEGHNDACHWVTAWDWTLLLDGSWTFPFRSIFVFGKELEVLLVCHYLFMSWQTVRLSFR
jgi:hypothetical protein